MTDEQQPPEETPGGMPSDGSPQRLPDETAGWQVGPGTGPGTGAAAGATPPATKRPATGQPASKGSASGGSAGSAGSSGLLGEPGGNSSIGVTAEHGAPTLIDETPSAEGLRFVRELGRGGLGSVWLAVQETSEFRRNVAVKLVRRGMDTQDILRRFALERQLLGALEHPNIVRLYGAGSTNDGRPYFVMEYVEGLPIDRYCDENRLGIEKRLDLFIQVCRAVQYAHTKLVVHRDLKPSNIIVGPDGAAKLLDFGIAKLVDSALSPVQIDPTSADTRVLTPEYASPEQIRGQPLSTASDVYSLGVVLFELLTGHRPYRIRTRLMREMERIVCEEEPLVPSTVVAKPAESVIVETSANGETKVVSREVPPEQLSKARGVAIEGLRKRLRGDLDVITLRALAKRPEQRYSTAEALAADVLRHLRGEPIEARPLGFGGRAYRFARRNRVAVGLSTLGVATLIGMTASAFYAQKAEGEAALRAAQQELAEMRLAQVRELSGDFLNDLYNRLRAIEGAAEIRARIADMVARQLAALEKQDEVAGARVGDQEFDRLLASAHRGLGRVRGDVRGESGGDFEAAKAEYVKALEILRALSTDPVVAASETTRASVAFELMYTLMLYADAERARGQLAEAKKLLSEAKAVGDARAAVATRDERQRHATALVELAEISDLEGDPATASDLFRRSIELRRAILATAPDDIEALRALAKGLVSIQSRAEKAGETVRALELAEEIASIRSRLAAALPNDARIAREAMRAQIVYGRALYRAGRANEAVDGMLTASVTATGRVERAPDSHEALSDRAEAYESVAMVLDDLGRRDEALERWRLARADLGRAASLAPGVAGYPRRAAYLGASEARTQAAAGDVAGGARTAASAADALEAILTAGATDTDSRTQAAIAQAVAAGLARRAGDVASADGRTARAEAILALLPEQSRSVLAPIIAREAGK
ncbi:MAG: protein kinase domain-containing protein [bacterium]